MTTVQSPVAVPDQSTLNTAKAPDAGRSPRWVIPLHILAVALVQSTWMGVVFVTPVLARKHFGANDWQTLLITASPTIFFSLSIFWNDLFTRRSMGRYLWTYWLWAGLPPTGVRFISRSPQRNYAAGEVRSARLAAAVG